LIAKAVKKAKAEKSNDDLFGSSTNTPKQDDDKASNQEIMSLAEKAEAKEAEILFNQSNEELRKEELARN
jgi:hypothetical protein